MDIVAQIAKDAVNAAERELRALGATRIPQLIDRELKAVYREAARQVQEGLKARLDVPEPQTLRSIVVDNPKFFRDEVTGGVRVAGPANAWLRHLTAEGVRLPEDGHRYLFVPLRKPLESPEAKRASINVRFNKSGNLNRNDQRKLVAMGRREPVKKPYTRVSAYPAVQGAFWGHCGQP
jgi:hypothetical protein